MSWYLLSLIAIAYGAFRLGVAVGVADKLEFWDGKQ